MLPYVLGEPIIRYRFPVGGRWFSSLRTSFGVRRSFNANCAPALVFH
jgi:hypothetical protein